ncbi:MAG TPA: isochorismatase family protein [Terracidiphilus sp.]
MSKVPTEAAYVMSGQFTPDNCALVLIDHQVGTLQFVHTMSPETSLQNAIMLAKAAKAYGMPVVLTTSQEDHPQGPTAPALQEALPEAYKNRVKRPGIVNAWADPNFSAAVRATGRKKLIMAAVTTDICLIFPAISAVQDGFEVLAVLDASGSSFDVQEELARRRMATAGVMLTTTNTAIAELVQDWSTPQGSQLIQLLMASVPKTPGHAG